MSRTCEFDSVSGVNEYFTSAHRCARFLFANAFFRNCIYVRGLHCVALRCVRLRTYAFSVYAKLIGKRRKLTAMLGFARLSESVSGWAKAVVTHKWDFGKELESNHRYIRAI